MGWQGSNYILTTPQEAINVLPSGRRRHQPCLPDLHRKLNSDAEGLREHAGLTRPQLCVLPDRGPNTQTNGSAPSGCEVWQKTQEAKPDAFTSEGEGENEVTHVDFALLGLEVPLDAGMHVRVESDPDDPVPHRLHALDLLRAVARARRSAQARGLTESKGGERPAPAPRPPTPPPFAGGKGLAATPASRVPGSTGGRAARPRRTCPPSPRRRRRCRPAPTGSGAAIPPPACGWRGWSSSARGPPAGPAPLRPPPPRGRTEPSPPPAGAPTRRYGTAGESPGPTPGPRERPGPRSGPKPARTAPYPARPQAPGGAGRGAPLFSRDGGGVGPRSHRSAAFPAQRRGARGAACFSAGLPWLGPARPRRLPDAPSAVWGAAAPRPPSRGGGGACAAGAGERGGPPSRRWGEGARPLRGLPQSGAEAWGEGGGGGDGDGSRRLSFPPRRDRWGRWFACRGNCRSPWGRRVVAPGSAGDAAGAGGRGAAVAPSGLCPGAPESLRAAG